MSESCNSIGFYDGDKSNIPEIKECETSKYIPESLKTSSGGPIMVIDGGGSGGGAQMGAYLKAYLEAGKPIPKAIIGSSIGSMIAIYLQYKTKDIPPLKQNATNDEKIKYDELLRKSMIDALDQLFVNEFEWIGTLKNILDFISSPFGSTPPIEESASSTFFTTPVVGAGSDIFDKKGTNHFDVGVALSIDTDTDLSKVGFDKSNPSFISYNHNITSEYIDASTAHNETLGKKIGNTNFRDGNYGDFVKTLGKDMVAGQKVIFLSSYNGERPYDFAGLKDKAAIFENIPTNSSNGVTDKNRFDMTETHEIYDDTIQKARDYYGVKKTDISNNSNVGFDTAAFTDAYGVTYDR